MGELLESMEWELEVEDPTLAEKAFDIMLRGALTGIEVEIEKGVMIMIGIGIMIEIAIGLESVIDRVTVSWREKEDMTIHMVMVMIEPGTCSFQGTEIKIEIW